MSTSKLMKVTYYDPKSQIRLLCYADTVVWDTKPTPTLTALRFGGYPERVQGLADAIYGGATIEIEDGIGSRPSPTIFGGSTAAITNAPPAAPLCGQP